MSARVMQYGGSILCALSLYSVLYEVRGIVLFLGVVLVILGTYKHADELNRIGETR